MPEWQSRGFRFHISIFSKIVGHLGQNTCNFVEPRSFDYRRCLARSLAAWVKEAFRPRLVSEWKALRIFIGSSRFFYRAPRKETWARARGLVALAYQQVFWLARKETLGIRADVAKRVCVYSVHVVLCQNSLPLQDHMETWTGRQKWDYNRNMAIHGVKQSYHSILNIISFGFLNCNVIRHIKPMKVSLTMHKVSTS